MHPHTLLRLAARLAAIVVTGAALLPALAAASEESVAQAVNRFVQAQTAQQAEFKGADVRAEVLSAAVQLPSCQQPRVSSPRGNETLRPGRLTLELHCQGEQTRYLPIRLIIHGDYLETTHPLTPGDTLSESSIRTQRGDLGELPHDVVRAPQNAVGKLAVRRLEAGTVLRSYHLRPRPVVKRGQNVAVESRGQGFVVKRDGVAMEDGGVGDTIRVRLSRRDILEAQVTKNGRLVLQH